MTNFSGPDDLDCGAVLYDAVRNLRGKALDDALGRIARRVLHSPSGGYFPAETLAAADLDQVIVHDGEIYGRYAVSGRVGGYSRRERDRLVALARLTGRLLRAQAEAERQAHELELMLGQLRQQTQILDQIHESVITMDLAGFITSWNKGAERLFGYCAAEAVGRNVLFLYEDQDQAELNDIFLEQGGREMDVRRRKKSGEVFWASLSLTPMSDHAGNPTGLIGYLTDITDRKQAEERIHYLAYYDALTGLPNRSLLMKLTDHALTVAQRSQTQASLLFVDLNRFKPINDTLGHSVGDRLLQQVAMRFRASLRNEDILARLGSDEFVIGLFDLNESVYSSNVAQKLLASLEAPFWIDDHELRIGASIGISVFPQDGNDSVTLLRLADIAMFRTKQGTENSEGGYTYYCDEMNERILSRLRIESGLRHAIKHDQLLLHYQPKVDLRSGRIIGAEALVRWNHPERGMVQPVEFIPVAEETGLILLLGDWVLRTACAQARAWQQAGIPALRIAVNVSAREFTAALPGRVRDALLHYGLDAAWLELEITESMLMQSIDRVITIMDQIASLGITLALDDFGTGYSSLSYLKRFPIDTLKIDGSFTRGIPGDVNDCAIASSIIGIGKQLKHKVIAEGVENAEQLAYLSATGCDEIQGYFFSRPVTADEFEAMLREDRRLGS
jgi:diguanylate cyclase (GGDEF)-like protein/PAS domain S-box-containing protein